MKTRTWLILALLIMFAPLSLQAQGQQPELAVMHTVTTEDKGLALQVYFTARDENGLSIPPHKIESATLSLREDTEPVFAALEDPTTPMRVALVLDESGSMKNFIGPVRDAAIASIDRAPSNSEFAVFTFSEVASEGSFVPRLEFTGNRADVKNFIREQYNPQNLAPTCLFNAAVKATQHLAERLSPEERRAIILFTDGKDERADGSRCSDSTLNDVIHAAAPQLSVSTPIYTIGLCAQAGACGNLDAAVLERMASQTSAMARTGSLDQIAAAFFDIMDNIRSQKLARAVIRPCEERQVTLAVQVIGIREPLRSVIPFSTDKCYAPRADAEIQGFVNNSDRYNFQLTVDNVSPVEVQKISVNVLGPSNTSVYSEVLEAIVPPKGARELGVDISQARLSQEGGHLLQIAAIAADGTVFLRESEKEDIEDEQVLAEHPFKHTPLQSIGVTIASIPQIDYQKQVLSINRLDIADEAGLLSGQEDFLQYRVVILDQDTPKFQSQAALFDLSNPAIEIPLSDLPPEILPTTEPKKYRIVVKLIAPNLTAASEPLPFDFPQPPQRSFWGEYGLYLLGGLLLVATGAAGWYVLRNRRPTAPAIPQPYNPPTLLQPARKLAERQLPTEVHTPAKQTEPQLRIKVLKTPAPSQIREQIISQFPCVIGRGEVQFSIAGDPSLSRNHIEIRREDDAFYITDLGSKNGVYIEEQRVEAQRPVRLHGRTALRLGKSTYVEIELL